MPEAPQLTSLDPPANGRRRRRGPPPRTHKRLMFLNAVVSGITAASEYLLYISLVELAGVLYLYANVAAGVLGVLVNFGFSRFWVFRDTHGRLGWQFVRFALVTGLGISASTGLLYVLVHHLGVPYWIAWAIANLGVFSLWTYPTNRYLVFPEAPRRPGPQRPEPPVNAAEAGTRSGRDS